MFALKISLVALVLKRTLRQRPVKFVRWLIAHEVAHAHLRHAGRWPGEDPESAADGLAATWKVISPLLSQPPQVFQLLQDGILRVLADHHAGEIRDVSP